MPISYGQVKGRKYTTIQPDYDPEHPKQTRYPAKQKNTIGAYYKKYEPRKPKPLKHGVTAYRDNKCGCDICRKAYEESVRRSNERHKGEHIKDGGKMIRCRICEEWKPREEFPFLHLSNNQKYVCEACRGQH